MLKPKILAGIVVAVTATVLLDARGGVAEPAADDCKAGPGSSAPPGTHWYYRINRADQRHCWYLGSQGTSVRSHAVGAMSPAAASDPQHNDDSETMPVQTTLPQVASAQAAPADAAPMERLAKERAPADFAARWPELPSALDLGAGQPAAMNDRFADNRIRADDRQIRPDTAATTHISSAFIAGALMMASLLLAGRLFRFARRPGRRRVDRPAVRRRVRGDVAETAGRWSRCDEPAPTIPTPTDPARDLKTSLQELMRDLHRVDAAMPSQPPARFTRCDPVL